MTASASEPHHNLRQWWSAITLLIAITVFMQAAFAGAILSGIDFAYIAHKITAAVLTASTIMAGLVATLTLRSVPNGLKLGLMLLSLAVVIILQTVLGKLSANGANLMWLHVPLGVALVGFAANALSVARKLGMTQHVEETRTSSENPTRKLWSI